jgi:uncharacterized protein YjgD (DUF1641 family)
MREVASESEVQETAAPTLEPVRERRTAAPASPAAVREAIDDVTGIINTLKDALDEMDEVLETLELAERQKTADEHEIESLRRAMRQLRGPRDAGRSGGRPPES